MSDRALLIAGIVAGVLILSRRNAAAATARAGIPVVNQNKDLYIAQGAFKFLGQVLQQPAQLAVKQWLQPSSASAGSKPAATSNAYDGWTGGGDQGAGGGEWEGTQGTNDSAAYVGSSNPTFSNPLEWA